MTVHLRDTFNYCPRCGKPATNVGQHPFDCPHCEFVFFFNPVTAVGGIITDDEGKVLLLRRARDPGKGKYGMPGGFVDAGESVDQALRREVQEEVNLEVTSIDYLCSLPNNYTYRGITSTVADVFFTCQVRTFETLKIEESEVIETMLVHPTEAELGEMAFASNRQAVELFLARQK